jgi:hypothetical protein
MGSNVPKKNRPSETAAEQRIVDGITKHAAFIPTYFLNGIAMPTADVLAVVQRRLDAGKRVEQAKTEWLAAIAAEREERDRSRVFMSTLKQFVLAAFRGQLGLLADFGLVGPKVPSPKPAALVASAVKAKATRAARHTMGKNQRAAIVGSPPSFTVVPVTPTAASTPVAQPAPAPAPSSAGQEDLRLVRGKDDESA